MNNNGDKNWITPNPSMSADGTWTKPTVQNQMTNEFPYLQKYSC